MAYPKLKQFYLKSNLEKEFTISRTELQLINENRPYKEKNLLGFLVLLKCYLHLGYPPRQKREISKKIIDWIASQFKIDPSVFNNYKWKGVIWKRHLAVIRGFYKFRPPKTVDLQALKKYLITQIKDLESDEELMVVAVNRCKFSHFELPSEKELLRLINSTRHTFLQTVCQKIAHRINRKTKTKINKCLDPKDSKANLYRWLKLKPGRLGMKTILEEVEKLQYVRGFDIDGKMVFKNIPRSILHQLYKRVRPEDNYQMRRHPGNIRYSFMVTLLFFRQRELTDNIVQSFIELIRRISKKAEKDLEKTLIRNIKKIYGKGRILYRLARALTENPDGTVRDVVLNEIGEDTLLRIISEYENDDIMGNYDSSKTRVMKTKFTHYYRRMLKPVLDTLVFKASNPAHQPIIDGLRIVKRYLVAKHTYYPQEENIPDQLLSGHWKKTVYQQTPDGNRVLKHYFELCVLERLEKALNCKEIWVEDAYLYRNPDLNLPQDWNQCSIEYCTRHKIPLTAEDFIDPIKQELTENLEKANEFFSKKQDTYIYFPGRGKKGIFRVPKIKAKPERPILKEIKNKVLNRFGVQDLLDVLIEADRQIGLSKYFPSTGQRQILSEKDKKERLVLSLFGIATNTGLKRIHTAANPSCTYADLLYFSKRHIHADSVRNAIVALTNKILEVRSPEIWGQATTCASDGRYIGTWDQNLTAEWNPHYQKTGVMAYWHVDTNSTCIYSQLKAPTASQVSAMIKGLIHHDTEMRIDKNMIDTHGQSEVAFPFCRFMSVELSPRLKRIKYSRLYLPDKSMEASLPHLKGVIERPIRWQHAKNQYSEMARHVVAALERTGPIESILRRFNSSNRKHPTYKAFIELGKALKTIHVCKIMTQPAYRHEIFDALNVVENWNSSNNFISYGRTSEFQTNDPEMQELSILCLHLLQNALILVNTIMLEHVLYEENFIKRMNRNDFHAMTPLFTANINPYGYFLLNFDKPSFLEAI